MWKAHGCSGMGCVTRMAFINEGGETDWHSSCLQVMERQPVIDPDASGLVPKDCQGTIEFQDVDFKYPARPDFPVSWITWGPMARQASA